MDEQVLATVIRRDETEALKPAELIINLDDRVYKSVQDLPTSTVSHGPNAELRYTIYEPPSVPYRLP